MAVPVRPPIWPAAQTQAASIRPGRNDVRLAAQKAFFEAALAGKSAVAATPEPAPSTASPVQGARAAEATESRDRLPPPGSIVNILV